MTANDPKQLDKLLVYNRAQMGVGFEVEEQEVDLARACREEIEMLRASVPGVPIVFEAPESLGGMFDAGRIREVLANLVVNASKYGVYGGRIRVELRDGGNGVELVVTNSGDPIARGTFDLMFEPLRRGGVSDRDAERASLGLGLFIVSQIAQAHGGTIRGESADGETIFKLQLPGKRLSAPVSHCHASCECPLLADSGYRGESFVVGAVNDRSRP